MQAKMLINGDMGEGTGEPLEVLNPAAGAVIGTDACTAIRYVMVAH